MKLEPRQLDQEEAERFGVAPGWWAVDEIGTPVLGPHPSREGALVGIAKSGRLDSDSSGPGKSTRLNGDLTSKLL